MPKVSVIIPLYNQEQYILHTIQSILNQEFVDYEIIVIDDQSTDSSIQRLEPVKRQIKLISSKENKGVSATRNLGLKIATGDYIVFLDSDDLLKSKFLIKLVDFLNTKSQFDLVYCWSSMIDEEGNNLPEVCCYQKEGNLLSDLILANQFPIHCFMIRKACLDRIGNFDEEINIGEDWELWARIAKAGGNFGCIPEELVAYRVLKRSSMSGGRFEGAQMIKDLNKTIEKIYTGIKIDQILEIKHNVAYYLINLQMAGLYALHKQYELAGESLNNAVRDINLNRDIESFIANLTKQLTPRGYRCPGGLAPHIESVERNFLKITEELFKQFPENHHHVKKLMYSEFYKHVGILLYCQRYMPQARRKLLKSFCIKPSALRNAIFRDTLLKAFLSARIINFLSLKKKRVTDLKAVT